MREGDCVKQQPLLFVGWGIAAVSVALTDFSTGALSFAAFLLLFTFIVGRKKHLMFSLLLVFLLFYMRADMVEKMNVTKLSGEENILAGSIIDGPYRDGNRAQFELKTTYDEKLLVTVFLHEAKEIAQLREITPHSSCVLRGELKSPLPSTVNFHDFDYATYLKMNRIHWLFELSSIRDLTCQQSSSFDLFTLVKLYRHYGLEKLDTLFEEPMKGIAGALIFGERHFLSANTEEAYQKLGLIHILAVSGLHVGLISGVVFFGLIRSGITRERAETILLWILPLYMIVAGFAPSVIRAGTVVMLYIIFRKMNVSIPPFPLLCYIALILLFIHPYYLFHVGFQLSFLISGSLLLSRFILAKRTRMTQMVLVTVISQITAFPVLLYHFYEFSLLSFVLNLIIVPVIAFLILPVVFLLFFLSFLNVSIMKMFSQPFNILIEIIHRFLVEATSWHMFHLVFGKPNTFFLWLLSFTIFWWLYRLDRFSIRKQKMIAPTIAVIFVCTSTMIAPYFNKYGTVTVLDVGQGDSIVIELPYRKAVYVIDGGGVLPFAKEEWQKRKNPYDPGKSIVVSYLKARGIGTIDKVVVTHGDFDHYGGLYSVLHDMRVKELLYGAGDTFKEGERHFLQYVNGLNIPIQWVKEGMGWKKDSYSFHVLWPERNMPPGNQRSIVIYTELGGVGWLFTGDIEEEVEEMLLQHHPHLRAEFLKVGHHGSRTSTTSSFVQQLQPVAAFISAGRCNRFGHPHKETLQTLAANGVKVYRSDEDGAIQVTFSDNHIHELKKATEMTGQIKKPCS